MNRELNKNLAPPNSGAPEQEKNVKNNQAGAKTTSDKWSSNQNFNQHWQTNEPTQSQQSPPMHHQQNYDNFDQRLEEALLTIAKLTNQLNNSQAHQNPNTTLTINKSL